MSYYRRRRWRSSWHSPKPSNRVSASYSKSLQFIRAEFFKLNPVELERVANLYSNKYGVGPGNYLRRTFPKWKSGATSMSGQTESRILSCVPPFLDKDKQFTLLSFQIPSVIHQQKKEFNSRVIKSSKLHEIYSEVANKINENEYTLDWFVNKVFPTDEIAEFINVFKYTMLDCLSQSFWRIWKDISIINEFIHQLDGSVEINYHIDLLDCNLEIDTYSPSDDLEFNIPIPEPRLITSFRNHYRKIILEHALEHIKIDSMSHANRQLACSDVNSIINRLKQTRSDQEYDTSVEIKGDGGILRIRLQKKNLLRLRYEIAKESTKLLLAIGVTGIISFGAIVKELWPLLIFGSFISFGIISSLYSRRKELVQEVANYEQRRTTRFTTT